MKTFNDGHLWTVGAFLLALAVGGAFGKRGIFSNVNPKGELSYFRGAIAPTDVLCLKFYIGKKTTLPLQVPVLTNLPLSAIKATAWEFNKIGFQMDVQIGGLGATTTVLNFHGPDKALYPIEVECYCTAAPPAVP
ncbi:uncharacterized protein LOC119769850 [Culex quinquefasciatus]|uniref:uncharacterized protein LOC119769850 n=1 Tax=Culex quinquefasciatus TaxID=7176 RepID=UPI0018E2BFD2|nr:uncharacterized protein LOC119769850 [Culex quinquefasciatus]